MIYTQKIIQRNIDAYKRPFQIIIESPLDYYICIPFRTRLNHRNGFPLVERHNRSNWICPGLDYSKIIIIKNKNYINWNYYPIIKSNQMRILNRNKASIIEGAMEYVNKYVNYKNGIIEINERSYERMYGKTSLIP